jgi:hypothetical protein
MDLILEWLCSRKINEHSAKEKRNKQKNPPRTSEERLSSFARACSVTRLHEKIGNDPSL